MKIMKNLLLGIVLVVAVIAGGYAWHDRKGIQNLRACKLIKPGVTVAEVIGQLGPPVHQWTKGEEHWMSFETSSIAAGPIRVRIESQTNRVLALYCSEDGQPLWELGK
jgi:hypothetical protein